MNCFEVDFFSGETFESEMYELFEGAVESVGADDFSILDGVLVSDKKFLFVDWLRDRIDFGLMKKMYHGSTDDGFRKELLRMCRVRFGLYAFYETKSAAEA